ncbi:hypothetical protein V5279_05400 [Bradyrhizobium sp. 26S5]|uniref:hypothetical protein n=1 Tax=Bradyrhizobium sp. 26S5 TaxID=3139729 RepID=UPI0030CEE5B1
MPFRSLIWIKNELRPIEIYVPRTVNRLLDVSDGDFISLCMSMACRPERSARVTLQKKAMGAASVSEIALFRRLLGVLRVWDIIITALPSAVIGD